jgi:hypothetical protein
MMDGEQLHGGDSETGEVIEDDRGGEPGVRPPKTSRYRRVPGGEALDVDLVDDRAVPRYSGTLIPLPVEGRIDHDGLGHEGGGITVVPGEV